MVAILEKMSQLFSTRGAVWAAVKWRPFSLSAFRITAALRDRGCQFDFVIDVGANEGQFARAIRATFPHAMVYGFEPLRAAYDLLIKNFSGDKKVHFENCALGAKAGRVRMNVNSFSQSSSILPIGKNHEMAFPDAREIGSEYVDLVKLDDALAEVALKKEVLLKIDVQGYEMEVLKGAQKSLSRVTYVLVEVGLVPLYVGEPSFSMVQEFLEARGLKYLGAVSVLKDRRRGVDIQMDALFGRIA